MTLIRIGKLRFVSIAALLVVSLGVIMYVTRAPLREALRGTAMDRHIRLLHSRLLGLQRQPAHCQDNAITLSRTNVVLIAIDTLRVDHLGFHGYDRDISPHMDALARDSLVFDRAMSAAPWTTPSFASVFTGSHPGALAMTSEALPLPMEVETLGEVLCSAGYETAGVVSNAWVGIDYGFDRGFEKWDQTSAGGHTYVSSAEVTNKAVDYLSQFSPKDRPFFLFVHYYDPHFDYIEHPDFQFSGDYAESVKSRGDNIKKLRKLARSNMLDEAALQYLLDCYDSEIAFVDYHIGRLLHALRAEGLYDKALVVFLADHGEMFAERENRWIGHTRYVYDEAIHVPLLFKLPNVERVGRIGLPVSLVDVPSTILDILQHPSPPPRAPLERSLLRLAESAAQPVFSQTRRDGSQDAVFLDEWKLLRDWKVASRSLFSIGNDKGELRDVASQYPQIAMSLDNMLTEWLAELETQSNQLVTKTVPLELTPEDEERLRGLGYID